MAVTLISLSSSPGGSGLPRAMEVAQWSGKYFPGTKLSLEILEVLDSFLIRVKIGDRSFLARTSGTHVAGENLMVEVESPGPTVILKVIGPMPAGDAKMAEYLRYWRADPGILGAFFNQARALKFLAEGNIAPADDQITDWIPFRNLINSSILSRQNSGDSLFLKNFMRLMGLSVESLPTDGFSSETAVPGSKENLKTLLGDLWEKLPPLLPKTENSAAPRPLSDSLGNFLRYSLRALETVQAVNVFSWEADSRYVLSIPFLQGEELRMFDLFISRESEAVDDQENPRWRFFLYLELDILGEVVADIRASGSTLGCIFLSPREETIALISAALPELDAQLRAAGFKNASLTCLRQEDLSQQRKELIDSCRINKVELVDCFA